VNKERDNNFDQPENKKKNLLFFQLIKNRRRIWNLLCLKKESVIHVVLSLYFNKRN
jgi:hypothetical protein